jgi:hypothetical protein
VVHISLGGGQMLQESSSKNISSSCQSDNQASPSISCLATAPFPPQFIPMSFTSLLRVASFITCCPHLDLGLTPRRFFYFLMCKALKNNEYKWNSWGEQRTILGLRKEFIHIEELNNTANHGIARFEVLTTVSTKMAVFWVVAPCSLVQGYRRFRGACCLHHQG